MMKKVEMVYVLILVATLIVGIFIGSIFSKEIKSIVIKTEYETIIKTETEYPEAVYAVVEVDNDTYYYDVFRWDANHHIYIRLNESWEKSFGYWWANNRGNTMYVLPNLSKYEHTGGNWCPLRFNDSVTVDEPYLWVYYTLENGDEHIYFGDPNGIHWVNLHENPEDR